jgi:drug/metabolite transporter (DMT)-like permease
MSWGVLLGGIVLLLLFGLWGITAKLAMKEIGLQIVIWAQVASTAIFPLYFVLFKDLLPLKLETGAIVLALITGALGIGGTIMLYLMLRVAPTSIVIPLSALYPLITIVLSFLILRERITPQQWLGIAFALLAIALLSIDFNQVFAKPQ